MNIEIHKTIKALENKLASLETMTLADLHKAYDYATKLRSQLLGLIHEKEYGFASDTSEDKKLPELLTECACDKKTVTLTIYEPLPPLKELTGTMQDHWVELLQTAIGKAAAVQELPRFKKAFVWIEVITPKYTDNSKLWDTSNRAVNLIINNLKGVFFADDDHENMAFGVTGNWGEKGVTIVHILSFDEIERISTGNIMNSP